MATTHETVIPERYRDLLNDKVFAHIATIGPHGEPQSSPVWIDWDGSHIKFSQTKTRRKLHNLQRDPHIAMSMTDPGTKASHISKGNYLTVWQKQADGSWKAVEDFVTTGAPPTLASGAQALPG